MCQSRFEGENIWERTKSERVGQSAVAKEELEFGDDKLDRGHSEKYEEEDVEGEFDERVSGKEDGNADRHAENLGSNVVIFRRERVED